MTARSGRNPSALLPSFGDRRRRRIGLLGGSFNPAHDGHIHLTKEALRTLGLDQVWWLVSPQNPLKPVSGMAPFAARLEGAIATLAGAGLGRRAVATGLEGRLGVTRTARTLHRLGARYPGITFVWLMGADNLAQISRWWRWTEVFDAARVAVFDRSPYSYKALAGCAAKHFARARHSAKALWTHTPPVRSMVRTSCALSSSREVRMVSTMVDRSIFGEASGMIVS